MRFVYRKEGEGEVVVATREAENEADNPMVCFAACLPESRVTSKQNGSKA